MIITNWATNQKKTFLGGAFSKVVLVTEPKTNRDYALKKMRMVGVVQCPDHVYCELNITKKIIHPFCLRQST